MRGWRRPWGQVNAIVKHTVGPAQPYVTDATASNGTARLKLLFILLAADSMLRLMFS